MQATSNMIASINKTPAIAIPIANFRVETQKSSSERDVNEAGESENK